MDERIGSEQEFEQLLAEAAGEQGVEADEGPLTLDDLGTDDLADNEDVASPAGSQTQDGQAALQAALEADAVAQDDESDEDDDMADDQTPEVL